MLVLTRKLEEQIVIGDNIKVTILRIKGNTVRVGIEAPRQVRVVRGELPRHEEPRVAAGRIPATSPVLSKEGSLAKTQAGETNRCGAMDDSGVPRCPPPLAAYLVGLIAHAS